MSGISEELHALISKSSPHLEIGEYHANIVNVADLHFEELQQQFNRLLSPVGDVATAPDANISPEGAVLLLRRCMSVLRLLEFNLGVLGAKCEILLRLLRRMSVYELTLKDPGDTAMLPCFRTSVLEVFIEEFLMHPELRRHFNLIDDTLGTEEKLFISSGCSGDLHVIQELVSIHFLLSVHNRWACGKFVNSLTWSKEDKSEITEIGFDAALTLLGMGTVSPAPKLLQAHLILLASRCISVCCPESNLRVDDVALNRSIIAVELSIDLYLTCLSTLNVVDNSSGRMGKSKYIIKKIPFDSCIRSVTCRKLNDKIDEVVSFSNEYSDGILGNARDILSSSVAYIDEIQQIVYEQFRQEAKCILKCIIASVLRMEDGNNTIPEYAPLIHEQIICLAAALKLMSSSLLQILCHVRQVRTSDGRKTLEDDGFCKESDIISGVIVCFAKCEVMQIVQENLIDRVKTISGGHQELLLMLAHFVGLLLYSVSIRFEVLWKGCIYMMMTVMNLIIHEEGSLDSFRPFLCNWSLNCQMKSEKGLVSRRSSVIVASNLQNIQKLYFSEENKCLTHKDKRSGAHGASPLESDKCDGMLFIECLPEFHRHPSEWEDLVDFIECKQGKDYSSWWRKRRRFRLWQNERRSKRRLQKLTTVVKNAQAHS